MRLLILCLTLFILTACYDQPIAPETSQTNTLTIYSDDNGIVVPFGTVDVEEDSSITLKATADEHYQFSKWIQVGVDEIVGLDSLSSVVTLSALNSSGVALKATFVPKLCTLIVLQSDSAYSLSPQDTLVVPYGDKVSITTKAKEGYSFGHWLISDVNKISTASLVDEVLMVAVYGNGAVKPLFLLDSTEVVLCTLVVEGSDSAYSITPKDTLIVPSGNKVSIATKARVGYVFDRWSISNVNALSASSMVDASIVLAVFENGSVKPLFRALNHDVTIDSAVHGTVNHVGTFTLSEHDSLEIIATPDEHYRFVQWKQMGEATVPIDDITSPTTFIRGVVGTGAIVPVFERRTVTAFYSSPFLATAATSTMLVDLFDENGNDLRIEEGDILEINIKDATTTYSPIEIGVGSFEGIAGKVSTVQELLSAIRYALLDTINGPGLKAAEVTLTADGRVNIALGGEHITSLNVGNKTRPVSDTYVKNLLSWSGQITGTINYSAGAVLRPAREYDYICEVVNHQGRSMGLEGGDEVTVSGIFNDEYLSSPSTSFVIVDDWGEPMQPMKDLIDRIQSRLDHAMGLYFEVSLNSDNPDYPKGAVLIIPSETNLVAFSDIKVRANNSNNNPVSPFFFNENMKFTYVYEDEN